MKDADRVLIYNDVLANFDILVFGGREIILDQECIGISDFLMWVQLIMLRLFTLYDVVWFH